MKHNNPFQTLFFKHLLLVALLLSCSADTASAGKFQWPGPGLTIENYEKEIRNAFNSKAYDDVIVLYYGRTHHLGQVGAKFKEDVYKLVAYALKVFGRYTEAAGTIQSILEVHKNTTAIDEYKDLIQKCQTRDKLQKTYIEEYTNVHGKVASLAAEIQVLANKKIEILKSYIDRKAPKLSLVKSQLESLDQKVLSKEGEMNQLYVDAEMAVKQKGGGSIYTEEINVNPNSDFIKTLIADAAKKTQVLPLNPALAKYEKARDRAENLRYAVIPDQAIDVASFAKGLAVDIASVVPADLEVLRKDTSRLEGLRGELDRNRKKSLAERGKQILDFAALVDAQSNLERSLKLFSEAQKKISSDLLKIISPAK